MLSADDLERLYVSHEKALYNIALRWTFVPAQAEELVQDAFAKVWDRRHEVAQDTAAAYVFQTLLNLAKNFARRRSTRERLKNLLAPLWPASDDREPAQLVDEQALQRALQQLPAKQRSVVLLCEFSGLNQVDIAQALGIAPGTVASRRHAALGRLKKLLQ
ncbi:MAG: sigma-70 family RNA polymerase sigma factor [Pseudomonadota bacterium]